MRYVGLITGTVAVALVAAAIVTEPWVDRSKLIYETVSGYPMRVYYRNQGSDPAQVIAANGAPALSLMQPLSREEIDQHFIELRAHMKFANSSVRGGDYVRFEVDDPDGLAWEPDKMDETSYFYVFAVIESVRPSWVKDKWVSELCLVAKTHERFQFCDWHNQLSAEF